MTENEREELEQELCQRTDTYHVEYCMDQDIMIGVSLCYDIGKEEYIEIDLEDIEIMLKLIDPGCSPDNFYSKRHFDNWLRSLVDRLTDGW